ncbi:MAG: Imm51 family immunity protein [Bradymonadia bacterium]
MLRDDTTYTPLLLVESDSTPGHYSLLLTDSQVGPVEEVFRSNGREPGGYGWADVALGALREHQPDLESRLSMDPEAGMFCAYGTDLDALKALGALLHGLFHDHTALAEAVKSAPYEYD